jgi:hypothetical protein
MSTEMPVELIVFTADRRISGSIPLADDRLSDMLNSVPRIVMRGCEVQDLLIGAPPQFADVTVAVGSIVAALVSGRRGVETRRRRTDVQRVTLGIVRYVVRGWLHIPAGVSIDPGSRDPATVLAGRDVLVPLTDATIGYERGASQVSEAVETILFNRSLATWIEVDDGSGGDASDLFEEPAKVYHAAMAKDFTGAS